MIKRVLSILAIVALSITVSCEKKEASISFTEKQFDFGTITQGDKVDHVFKFKNDGNTDLLIKDAKGSCGCTVPEFPHEPIKPGEESSIKVSFNSANKKGNVSKTVTLVTNTKTKVEILTIKANIDVIKGAETGTSTITPPASAAAQPTN